MLVWKPLIKDRVRASLSILGVAGSLVLIFLIEGLTAGIYEQATAFNKNSGADLVVASPGVDSFQTSRSRVPIELAEALEAHDGVDEVAQLNLLPVTYESHGMKTPIMIIGYELGQRLGRPWLLAEGRRPESKSEVVVDHSFAARHDLRVGDDLRVLGRDYRITGLSTQTGSWMNPYIFMDATEAADASGLRGAANYLLVSTDGSLSAGGVKEDIEAAAHGVTVLPSSTMTNRQANVFKEVMGSATNLMVGIAYVIGLLVIGLTSYAIVLAGLRDYGVIKALGAGNRRLYRTVLMQTLIITLPGFGLGLILAYLGRALIAQLFPQFQISLTAPVILWTFAGVLAIAVIGSLLPIRRAAKLDPAAVFK